MFDESVPVRCTTIAWFLWGAAGLLMLMGTVTVWMDPGPAPWFSPVVWWALYLVTGAAVWTVQVTIAGARRQIMARLDQMDQQQHADVPRLRARRQL